MLLEKPSAIVNAAFIVYLPLFLMNFPYIYIDTISMDLSILYFKGSQVKISNFLIYVFLSLMIVLI